MRIIGGTAAGRILKAPKGSAVRPTPDRVREALFNSLGARVQEAHTLELFGGTGALSLEALSRGAASALCVELSGKHAGFIRENAKTIGFGAPQFQVRVADVFDYLKRQSPERPRFDLVFADPPYGPKTRGARSESMAQRTLEDPNLPKMMAPNGLFLLGHAHRDDVTVPSAWRETRRYRYGDNVFLALEPAERVS